MFSLKVPFYKVKSKLNAPTHHKPSMSILVKGPESDNVYGCFSLVLIFVISRQVQEDVLCRSHTADLAKRSMSL